MIAHVLCAVCKATSSPSESYYLLFHLQGPKSWSAVALEWLKGFQIVKDFLILFCEIGVRYETVLN